MHHIFHDFLLWPILHALIPLKEGKKFYFFLCILTFPVIILDQSHNIRRLWGEFLSVNGVFKKDVVLWFTKSKGAWKLNAMNYLGLYHGPEKKKKDNKSRYQNNWWNLNKVCRSGDSIVSVLYFLILIIVVRLYRRVPFGEVFRGKGAQWIHLMNGSGEKK